MNISEFAAMLKKRKKLFLSFAAVAFVLMLAFTLFLNGISYEVNASIKIDSSILLLAGTAPAQPEKTINRITLSTDKLDDKSAMEYVQSNKEFFSVAPMLDYSEMLSGLSQTSFLHKTINSHSFKLFLKENQIITDETLSIVEQTDTLSIAVKGKDKNRVKGSYDKLLTVIPEYINEQVTKKLSETKAAVDSAVSADRARSDEVIKEYNTLKTATGFNGTVAYNSGLELLNTLSALSASANQNANLSNKILNLLSNELSPDLTVKSEDLSGLKLTTTLVPYVIIEIIASILLSMLACFVAELFKSNKTK